MKISRENFFQDHIFYLIFGWIPNFPLSEDWKVQYQNIKTCVKDFINKIIMFNLKFRLNFSPNPDETDEIYFWAKILNDERCTLNEWYMAKDLVNGLKSNQKHVVNKHGTARAKPYVEIPSSKMQNCNLILFTTSLKNPHLYLLEITRKII